MQKNIVLTFSIVAFTIFSSYILWFISWGFMPIIFFIGFFLLVLYTKQYKNLLSEILNEDNQKYIQFTIGIIGLAGVFLAYQAFQKGTAAIADRMQIIELVKQIDIPWDERLRKPYFIGDPESYNSLIALQKREKNPELKRFIESQLNRIQKSYTAVTWDIAQFKNNEPHHAFCLDGIPNIGTACEENIPSKILIQHAGNIRNCFISCAKATQLLGSCNDCQSIEVLEALNNLMGNESLGIRKIALDSFRTIMNKNKIDFNVNNIFAFKETKEFFYNRKNRKKIRQILEKKN